jgi:hypothetical protein
MRWMVLAWSALLSCASEATGTPDAAPQGEQAMMPPSDAAVAPVVSEPRPRPDTAPAEAAPPHSSGDDSEPAPSDADVGPEPASSAAVSCDARRALVDVSGADRSGYPPYAVSGCSLLYVAPDGALRLRDPASEQLIAPASERPSRPTLAGPASDPARVIAWESGSEQHVRVRFAGVTRSIHGTYARSGQPRATSDAVVLSAWTSSAPDSDADVLLYEPESDQLRVIGGGPGQQLFADVSATQVAFSDFSEDRDGSFDDDGQDVANLVLVERGSLQRRTLELTGKQAFPLFTQSGQLVYLSWSLGHPEPKLAAYAIMAWDAQRDSQRTLAQIETKPPYVRPSVFGDTVEWVERPNIGNERLMRARVLGGAPEIAFERAGTQLFATASSPSATLLATLTESQASPRLLAVAR